MNPKLVFEIGLIIIAVVVLMAGWQWQQQRAIEERHDTVIEQTFEAEYGPREMWDE